MPSFTSNSDFPRDRSPGKNWLLAWAVALLAAGVVAAGAEVYWRAKGHRPSVTDSPAYWSLHRSRVSDAGARHIVLLGASRMQLGFSTGVFRERFPAYKLTQLAINARLPIATLRDLAQDEAFRGIIVCSLTESGLNPDRQNDQQEYVEFYRERFGSTEALDSAVGGWLQSRLVILNPQVRPDRALTSLLATGDTPRVSYITTLPDRSRQADYTLSDPQRLEKFRGAASTREELPEPAEWLSEATRAEEWVKQIQERGGRVVFVRFPTSGEHWEADEDQHPKADYWDHLAEATSADTIHFIDYPALSGFDLPDTSHLDYRDAPAFTNSLLDELERRGVLAAP